MRSFADLDQTFGSQPRELGAALARIDTGQSVDDLKAALDTLPSPAAS
jgi:hypothetical protein